ncbi:MAG: ABC transporter permease [Myxococcaceae bacterium]|nr:ABC transporter permease [Myxococcaceae bacterium]
MSGIVSLAARNVGRHRRRTTLTVTAVAVCVAAMVLSHGLGRGGTAVVVNDLVEARTGALQVRPRGGGPSATLAGDGPLRDAVARVPGVRAVTGRLRFLGLVGNGVAQTAFAGRGIEPQGEALVCPRAGAALAEGTLLQTAGGEVAVVGQALARSLGVGVGGHLTVQTSSAAGRSDARELAVVGLTSTGMPAENKRVLQVPLSTAQALLGAPGQVSELVVAVESIDGLEALRARVQAAAGPQVEVLTWQELQPFAADYLARTGRFLVVMAVVLVLVGATIIGNTIATAVHERQVEIGTLLSFGVRRAQVGQLFLAEAVLLGVLGAAVGGLGGQLAAHGLAVIGLPLQAPGGTAALVLRPDASWSFTALVALAAVVVTALTSVFPAVRAARLDPVAALRR